MTTLFYTGCSLDGFIADPDHDLSWLVSRDIDMGSAMGFETVQPRLGAAVMGASTWQWLVDHGEEAAVGGMPTWVLTHRDFAPADGVRFVAADTLDDVRSLHAEAVEAAGGKDLWLVGGGALVARFVEAGLVDELWVQLAPVTLGAGAPLLPARVELQLEEVVRNGDFVCTRYTVLGPGSAPVG
ncbi:dihydrofolate reductase family protein [Nocardioides daphniae]|uniref:Dihydrofolate reductase n=1 Tax=Nocardioides daphniae TaxID=402297 RepID=A0A4P7UFM8_9ACTN|nr:dihydrofolate reductase family protein [Nocardioides daphniae]QCC78088.1 dihydrofolate reductase [Nocardioides daphniae]GGD22219.1 dihydrofolate reductase [Nocardioides daphniae]